VEFEGKLRNGSRVLFRHIRPDDKQRLQIGFEMLSEASRYRRFFRYIDHLSDEDLRYLTEVDFKDHYAWIAILPDEPGEPGLAVARWIRIKSDPEAAEAAITVIDAYQGEGLGSTLLWLLGRSAVENGLKALRVWVQGENVQVLAMLGDFGVKPQRWESGVSEVDIPLPTEVDAWDQDPSKIVLRAVASGELQAHQHSGLSGASLSVPDTTGREDDSDGAPDRT
jgi:GNAT superfamily N-acetyltransferase